MTGICGWFGACEGDPGALIAAMRRRITWNGATTPATMAGAGFGLAADGPVGTAATFESGAIRIALQGHAQWSGDDRRATAHELCRRLADAYRVNGAAVLSMLEGDFAVAVIDGDRREALLAIDRAGIRNLVYCVEGSVLAFAANLDALAAHPSVVNTIDAQALYDYVHFHTIPGPQTAFERSRRLLPGEYLLARGEGVPSPKRYWEMRFDEDQTAARAELSRGFRSALRAAVDVASTDPGCGAFLSGGTDSSTVVGLLTELRGGPVKTFSIGFETAAYDETEYARIAARHFRTEHHEYYVTPTDVAEALEPIAAEYDQPFGNASAVPTYYCAKLARSAGVSCLLAGDGGDELFGGNARYATQYLLSLYERLPAPLRHALLEPALLRLDATARIPMVRKVRRYVEQARLPLPDRYETHNLLEQLGPENVFEGDFLASVDRRHPRALMAMAHDAIRARSLINRMLAIDLKLTLADNDLPKVTRMCDLAGVDVRFPLLDERIVAFSAHLAPNLKLRGTKLRYFFKEALRGFLPHQIIAKKKHGFGLPAGVWLSRDPRLRELAGDALRSLAARGIVRAGFLRDLLDRRLSEHPAYYGTMVWVLMMLELWFRKHGRSGSR